MKNIFMYVKRKENKMIGIIAAMESELKAIESKMEVSHVETVGETVLHLS